MTTQKSEILEVPESFDLEKARKAVKKIAKKKI